MFIGWPQHQASEYLFLPGCPVSAQWGAFVRVGDGSLAACYLSGPVGLAAVLGDEPLF